MRGASHGMRRARAAAWLLAAIAAAGAAGCGRSDGSPGGAAPGGGPALSKAEADTLRARSEAQFAESNYEQAYELLKPLLDVPAPAVEDFVRGGVLLLARDKTDEAAALVARAVAAHPDDPGVLFLRANVLRRQLDFAGAAGLYRRVLVAYPDDNAVKWLLAETLDAGGQTEEPLAIWKEMQAQGFAKAGPFYLGAIYRIGGDLIQHGHPAEGLALREESKRLQQETKVKPVDVTDAEKRGPGRMQPVRHESVVASPAPAPPAAGGAPAAAPQFHAGPVVDLHGAARLLAADVDADGRIDLVGGGPAGLWVAQQDGSGAFAPQVVFEQPVVDVAAADLDAGDAGNPADPADPKLKLHHPPLELLAIADSGDGTGDWLLFSLESGGWTRRPTEADAKAQFREILASDFDHDGWLDLVLAGEPGLTMRRNLGTVREAQPQFPLATPDAAASLASCRAVVADDFDATLVDNEADYLVASDSGLRLLSNRRAGQFENTSAQWKLPAYSLSMVLPRAALACDDLDLDGRPDLLLLGPGLSWARNEGGHFSAPAVLDAEAWPGVLADIDLDGFVDRVDVTAAGVRLTRGPLIERAGGAGPTALVIADFSRSDIPKTRLHDVAIADLDGDLDPDVVVGQSDGVHVLLNDGPVGRALPLALHGMKDNAQGVGAIVELRAGATYRRLYWSGRPTLLGLGAAEKADVLRITWTNGIVQGLLDVPAGTPALVTEPNRQVGSCPFLYTWNGATFTFISDVLGTTPLGLPMAPGVFVPFDHDEYVKVRGDQLVPRGGRLEVAVTEELREVTYLDRLRLHAIDHPAGVEIQPNEGFAFPPFPPHHVHTFRTIVPPARAVANAGTPDEQDVTAAIGSVDGEYAAPFRALPWVFKGLAAPWSLDLTLAETPEQRAALAAAPQIRLALTGWFQWSDASVNVAAARHPTIEFEPPLLWVPARPGEAGAVDGWVPAGPPIGFPAGKTKTLVVDVTGLLRRDDPRLRMTTTLQLSWDAIRVVLDADDAPFVDTPLEPLSAELAYRGFSAPLPDPSGALPERFDWDALAPPRWNPHPGRYTRYGDVAPLLGAADDRYVIFGAGDCVRAAFDAAPLPPLPPGWTRDWLLFLDGWAKDRDPNTAAALEVGPLPFHAMSAYPPPAGESFPWDEAHRAWDREWNTREAAVLIAPLALPLTGG